MKATIEIPDALYRQIKSRSALGGRSIRDVTIEAYQNWLAEKPGPYGTSERDSATVADTWLAAWEALGSDVTEAAVDPRTTREILLEDRR